MKTLTTMAGVAALLCLTALPAKATTLTNWARAGIATQSTTYPGGDASKAIEGNTSGWWSEGSVTHTADSENNATSHPWWQVDLQETRSIAHLHIWFRDDCCQVRNNNLRIVIYDRADVATRVMLWETNTVAWNDAVPRELGFDLTPAINGRVIYVDHLPDHVDYFPTQNFVCISELEAFDQTLISAKNHAQDINGAVATSSSCYVSNCELYGPQQANDGNLHGATSISGWVWAYSAPDNTAGVDPLPWWQVELAAPQTVGSLVLWPRRDRTFARYNNIRVSVADQNNTALYQQLFTVQPSGMKFVVNFVPALANAKIVKVETTAATPDKFLNLPEVQVFAPLAPAPTLTFATDLRPITVNEGQAVTFGPVAVTVDGGIRPEDISYRWYRNGAEIPNMAGSWLKSHSIARVLPSDNGDKYKVQASVSGHGLFSTEVPLTVIIDTAPPVLQYATGYKSMTKVRVWFSEPLDPASAQTASNYQLSDGLTVTSATLSAPAGSAGDNIVDLVTSAQTPGQTYTLTVTGVKDQSSAGQTVAPGSTVQFRSWVVDIGQLEFAVWTGLSTADNSLTNTLRSDPRFPNSPSSVAYTASFSSRPVYPDDTHEGYGGRMSGYLIPTETADYRFFLYSDDSSELRLSTSADPAAAVKIAEETDCCDTYQEPGVANDDGFTYPTSEPVRLAAGQRYYVEALWKEGTGGDYCHVAWRKETDTTPANLLAPIPGQYLATYVDPNVDMAFVTQPTDQLGILPSPGIEFFTRDFNADDGGFAVENFGQNASNPVPPPGPWVYDSANGQWSADGAESACSGPYNSQLSSPGIKLSQAGTVSLTFSHRYSFEVPLWDAGQVRISVNGGAFTLVPAENFTENGYAEGAIIGSGIALGSRGFNGDSTGYAAGQFITSKALLGTFSKDDTLVVQFVGAWDDCTTGSVPGWVIDRMSLDIVPMIIQDFGKNNGNFTVENSATPPPANMSPWVYDTTKGQWAANGSTAQCGGPWNSRLNSPAYVVPQTDEVTLTFTQRYSFESDLYDGGQVRISVNGGAFTAVPAESFSANGYADGAIVGNGILKDQRAFNGDSAGYSRGAFITSSAVLGTFNQNDAIVVQFLGGWDECSGGTAQPSWVIKSLQLAFGKAAKASTFTAEATGSLQGQPVTVFYQWQRNDGAAWVDIAGADDPSFRIFPTAADFKATFRVVAIVPGKELISNVVKLVTEIVQTPTISLSASPTGITITFTGTLQSSAVVNGAYQDVAGAQSPYVVAAPTGVMFFRSVVK